MDYSYRIEDLTFEMDTADCIRRFRDEERINGYCRMCGNYGNSWACPPFLFDMEKLLRGYRNVFVVATRIIPAGKDIPFAEIDRYLLPERISQEKLLLSLERMNDARSFAYAGTCLYCPGMGCARKEGRPCRHPELMRSSLEAAGFDVSRMVAELFGFGLKWGSGGFMPEYLTLVGALFHNEDRIVWRR